MSSSYSQYSSEKQKTFQLNEDSFNCTSLVQYMSKWLQNKKYKQSQTKMDFSSIQSLKESSFPLLSQTNKYFSQNSKQYQRLSKLMLVNIEQMIRDTSNAIISTEIRQYNFKSSKQKCSIDDISQSCFSQISMKILENYINSLEFMMLTQLQLRQNNKETGNSDIFRNGLEKFMRDYLNYTKLKYVNLAEDEDDFNVMPNMEVRKCVDMIGKSVNLKNQELNRFFVNKVNLEQEKFMKENKLNNLGNEFLVRLALNNELMGFSSVAKESLRMYQQLLRQIHSQIILQKNFELNQILSKKFVMVDGFKTQIASTYLKKIMLNMIEVLQSKMMKMDNVKQKKQKKVDNVLMEKDINKMNKSSKGMQKSSPKKKMLTKTFQKQNRPNQESPKQSNQKESKYFVETFTQFFKSQFLGQYQSNKSVLKSQNQTNQQQILSIAYEYNISTYQSIFNKLVLLITQFLQLSPQKESSLDAQKQITLIEQVIRQSMLKSIYGLIFNQKEQNQSDNQLQESMMKSLSQLIHAQVECGNIKIQEMLKNIMQMINSGNLQMIKIKDDLRKKDRHQLVLYVRLKIYNSQNKIKIQSHAKKGEQKKMEQKDFYYSLPLQIKIRLDQQNNTLPILRNNYNKLYDFLQNVASSPLGVAGELAQYLLSTKCLN